MRILVAMLWLTAALTARAEGIQARSGQECALMADVALVARSLETNGVDADLRAPVLDAIYAPDDDRYRAMVREVDRASRYAKDSARDWAGKLYAHCIENRGAMGGFLGVLM